MSESEAAHVRNILMRHIGGHPPMNVQGITTEEVEGEGKMIVADVFALERNDRRWKRSSPA